MSLTSIEYSKVNVVLGIIFLVISLFFVPSDSEDKTALGVVYSPCSMTDIDDDILNRSVLWQCEPTIFCSYPNSVLLDGEPQKKEGCCDLEDQDTCLKELKLQQIQYQHDLWKQTQDPEQRALALRLACMSPENAQALDILNGSNQSVDSLFLKGCYLSKSDFQEVINQHLYNSETAGLALLLIRLHDLELPKEPLLESQLEQLIFQWVSGSS